MAGQSNLSGRHTDEFQTSFDDVESAVVETVRVNIQRKCLERVVEHVGNARHEDNVPHEQNKQRTERRTFGVNSCTHSRINVIGKKPNEVVMEQDVTDSLDSIISTKGFYTARQPEQFNST